MPSGMRPFSAIGLLDLDHATVAGDLDLEGAKLELSCVPPDAAEGSAIPQSLWG